MTERGENQISREELRELIERVEKLTAHCVVTDWTSEEMARQFGSIRWDCEQLRDLLKLPPVTWK